MAKYTYMRLTNKHDLHIDVGLYYRAIVDGHEYTRGTVTELKSEVYTFLFFPVERHYFALINDRWYHIDDLYRVD